MTMNDSSIRLRPLRLDDAEIMHGWRRESTINRFNPLDDLSIDALAERLSKEGHDLSNRECTSFRWMVEKGGEAVGSVAISSVAWRMGYAEIGYLMGESQHGKGLGTSAVNLLVNKVFAESSLRRLIATISVENVPSWRLVERLGFTREGTLRQHYVVQGRPVDEYCCYGLLRSEWAPDHPTRANQK
jgi:ribosomal-protein-alanine N-acetyltransferase